MMRLWSEKSATNISIRVERKIVNMTRYADDKALVASPQKGLQELMNRLSAVRKECGMKNEDQ